jgi:hypothetical protein
MHASALSTTEIALMFTFRARNAPVTLASIPGSFFRQTLI